MTQSLETTNKKSDNIEYPEYFCKYIRKHRKTSEYFNYKHRHMEPQGLTNMKELIFTVLTLKSKIRYKPTEDGNIGYARLSSIFMW